MQLLSQSTSQQFKDIHVCVDTCALLSGKPLDCLDAWHEVANAMKFAGENYPHIKLAITNQLLREQTNTTDMQALLAIPGAKTMVGRFIQEHQDRVECYNTHVCRDFIKRLAKDILSLHARPVIDATEAFVGRSLPPDDPTHYNVDSVGIAKAYMYLILWQTNREKALELGPPPAFMQGREAQPVTASEVKQLGDMFHHVAFLRFMNNELIPHPALLTGIRNTDLWPWNDHYFDRTQQRGKLRDLHFNCADLSIVDMALRKLVNHHRERPGLFILVTHDGGLLTELLEMTYGLREVRQSVTSDQYRPLDESYNELIEVEHHLERTIDRILAGRMPVEDPDEITKAVWRKIRCLQKEREMIRDRRERLHAKGSWYAYEVMEEEDYERYAHRGLSVSRLPLSKVPPMLLLTGREFAYILQRELEVLSQLVRPKAGSPMAEAFDYLRATTTELMHEVRVDKRKFHRTPSGVAGLHKRLHRASYELLLKNQDASVSSVPLSDMALRPSRNPTPVYAPQNLI